MEKIMSRTGHSPGVYELTESELNEVCGGNTAVDAWYQALGRLHLPLPPQGNWMTDILDGCTK
jgi:hypothetical protein